MRTYIAKIIKGVACGSVSLIIVSCAVVLRHPSATLIAPQLNFANVTSIATYTCTPITVSTLDGSGQSWTATSNLTVTLSGLGQGSAYSSLANCKTGTLATSNFVLTAGSANFTFYYRTNTAESLTLAASGNAFTDGTLATATHLFQVLGQPNTTSAVDNYGGLSSQSLSYPYGVYSDGTRLFVADNNNHRVLVWNSLPTSNQQSADFALGQPNLTSNTYNNGGISGSSMGYPVAVYSDGTRLFVVDNDNHRILVWNTMPTSSGQSADFALGQPNLTSRIQNNGGISGSTLSYPNSVYRVGNKLFVADGTNFRVLVWNSLPTANGQSADFALGQPDLVTRIYNNGGITGAGMGPPFSVYSDGTRLFVTDGNNNRVLVWNSLPSAFAQSADLALGQPSLNVAVSNNGGISATSLSSPYAVNGDGTKIFVADSGNSRVLIWNSIPSGNGQAADAVFGQPGFTTGTYNNGGVLATSLTSIFGLFSDGTRIFVVDSDNSRISITPVPGI